MAFQFPVGYNGVGLHDTPGSTAGSFNRADSQAHAQLLREHGVTTYKLFAEGPSKLERARAYVEAGIVPVVRFYVDRPWGRGNYSWVTPYDQMAPYYDAGVRFFEPGWNEANIDCEWVNGIGGQTAHSVAVEAVNAWAASLGQQSQMPGSYMLFTSMTPGGNIDHRLVYPEVVSEIVGRGLQSSLEHMAVHIRSHNVPPSFKLADNPGMTISWAEQFWIVDLFAAAGMRPLMWSTEFGPAPFDDPNTGYGQLSYENWIEYAWTEFLQMNPAHVYPASPQLAGVHHWFEHSYGHAGAWTKDSLRDSQDTRVPAPTALWNRMAERVGELAFERFDEQPEPPIDPPNDYRLVDLVGKLPVHPTAKYSTRSLGAIDLSILHYSWVTPPLPDDAHEIEQIQSIARGHIRLDWPGIGYHFVVGPSGTVYQVNTLETVAYHASPNNTRSVGVCVLERENPPTDAQVQAAALLLLGLGYELKLHKELTATQCPGQYLGPLVREAMENIPPPDPPGWEEGAIDLLGEASTVLSEVLAIDELTGDARLALDDARDKIEHAVWLLSGDDPPDEPGDIEILDKDGNPKDWAWLTATFGLTPDDVDQGADWKVTKLQEGGPSTSLLVYGPPNTVVTFGWPDGHVDAPIESKGYVGFGMGSGAYYFLPNEHGPHYVTTGLCRVDGLGMLGGTEHRHVDVTVAPLP